MKWGFGPFLNCITEKDAKRAPKGHRRKI